MTELTPIQIATDKILSAFQDDAEQSFHESLEAEDYINFELFSGKLKAHVYYSLMLLHYDGDITRLNYWVEDLWDAYKSNMVSDTETDNEEEN